jgi:hypothetical protein
MIDVNRQDKKLVSLLSTTHDDVGMTTTKKLNRITVEFVTKTKGVLDYNKGIGGVDKVDRYLSSYPLMPCYVKEYKKIFFYVLGMAVLISCVLCKKITSSTFNSE